MSFGSCLVGLPKINWAAVNRENERYDRESYWCVTHYETHEVWSGRWCWDSTKRWDKTHPIRGFDNAERRLRAVRSGDPGMWKLREVSQYELEHYCTSDDDGHYKFNKLEHPCE